MKKTEIVELHNYATVKGGKCLLTNYTGNKQILLWECKHRHQWNAKWNDIKMGHWCPYCARNSKPSLKELQIFAANKNGKLISTEYKNCMTKLCWECEKKHQWNAIWNHITSSDSWCPECTRFKTEKLCKELLEQKLNVKLTKTRFKYNNKHYEWDGYDKEAQVAFEYQGYQHYIYPNFFHKTKQIFLEQQQKDKDKIQYAKENNIKLIIIPYTEKNNLSEYIERLYEGSIS